MARNRRNQSAAIRFGPALKAAFLCLLIGGSGVGYVWQKSQIHQLDVRIRAHEHRLAALRDQNDKLRKQLAVMTSPSYLEARVRELNLGLAEPRQSQIWRLPEPGPELPQSHSREREYAAQSIRPR